MSAIKLLSIEHRLNEQKGRLAEIEKGIEEVKHYLAHLEHEQSGINAKIVEIEQQKMAVGKKYLGLVDNQVPVLVEEPVENIADLKAEADRLHKVMGGRK